METVTRTALRKTLLDACMPLAVPRTSGYILELQNRSSDLLAMIQRFMV
jgi:hypothetical protein